MSFGTDLQGRSSHDALIQIQDAEIRMLENMKVCLQKKIEADKKYVSSLTNFVALAQKVEQTEYSSYCSVFKSWESIVQGTEKMSELLHNSVDGLSTKVTEKLTVLLTEKKSARKEYEDERNRLEKDFSKLKDDLQKQKLEYVKCVEKVRADRAKYEEIVSKGKGGAKLDEAKSKFQKSSINLHQAHNKYYLLVCEVKSHQENYRQKMLPTFLNYHQATQEILVHQCKDFLEEYQRLITFGTPEHVEICQSIEESVDAIKPDAEYTGEFMGTHKSDPFEPVTFEFDGKILDDYQGKLVPNELALDTFTAETVTHQKTSLEEEIKQLKKSADENQKELKEVKDTVRDQKRKLSSMTDEELFEYLKMRRKLEELKKTLAEQESAIETKSDVSKVLSGPLDKLGTGSPPPGLDLPEFDDDGMSTKSGGEKEVSGNKLSSFISKGRQKFVQLRSRTGGRTTPLENGSKPDTSPSYEDSVSFNTATSHPDDTAETKRLEDQDWFHGVLPREEVQRLLTVDGDFIVRESVNRKTNENQYVLSAYWQGYKHFIIQYHEGGWRFEGPCFPTIPELVMHQYQSGEQVTNKSQTILKRPIIHEPWELKNDDIQLERKIGNGNFGEVFKGLYKPREEVVAVKTCKDTLSEDQRKKFLMEGRILKQYDHPNIVQFIGIAAQRQPVMILMEYVVGGALLSYLRKFGKNQTRLQASQMCVDAANGMTYLAEKGCIHRDLAARNCLVGDNNVVKISDFGMSREEEEYTVSDGMKQIPIKWTAPEALNFGKYTTQCDVWSYGILMWEIFSNGQTPYPGWSNTQSRESVEQGYKMPAPTDTPASVYAFMTQCWDKEPSTRITFKALYKGLKSLVDKPPKTEKWQ